MLNLKIFVISLKRAKLRREKIQTTLTESGADFDFFRASDGCALTDDEKTLALSLDPKMMGGGTKRVTKCESWQQFTLNYCRARWGAILAITDFCKKLLLKK